VPLKFGLEVIQGHLKQHHSIDHILLPISLPLKAQLYLVPIFSYLTLMNVVTLKSRSGLTDPANLCDIRKSLKFPDPDYLFAIDSVIDHLFLQSQLRKKAI